MAEVIRRYELGDVNELPVKASTLVQEGNAIGVASGYARHLTTADLFAGFAEATRDNQTGQNGDINVRVRKRGSVVLAVTAAAITDFGKPVFASGSNTFTFTEGSNVYIGKVSRWVATGFVLVDYDANGLAIEETA